MTDRALLVAAARAPQLEHLALVGLPSVSVLGLAAFAGAARLQSLTLADLQAFDFDDNVRCRSDHWALPDHWLVART